MQDIVVDDVVLCLLVVGVLLAKAEGKPVIGGAGSHGILGEFVHVAAVGGGDVAIPEGDPWQRTRLGAMVAHCRVPWTVDGAAAGAVGGVRKVGHQEGEELGQECAPLQDRRQEAHIREALFCFDSIVLVVCKRAALIVYIAPEKKLSCRNPVA